MKHVDKLQMPVLSAGVSNILADVNSNRADLASLSTNLNLFANGKIGSESVRIMRITSMQKVLQAQ